MSLTDLVGWLALLAGGVALIRTFAIKRGPNLMRPLEEEIESLQSGRNTDRLEIAKLNNEIQRRSTLVIKFRKTMREMRIVITLLRNQIRSLGHVPGYGAEFETGPLEGEGDDA